MPRYTDAHVRLENRPAPADLLERLGGDGPDFLADYERELADAGVDARWISIVDGTGSPRFDSDYLPPGPEATEENERLFDEWIDAIHDSGMSAVTWYPMTLCLSGRQENPEWAVQHIGDVDMDQKHNQWNCCTNSPYGDALIGFSQEAVSRFELDGIWFDGSSFTQIWDRPVPVTCKCEFCKEQFNAATGHELPEAVDWSEPAFREWVAWRYEAFSDFWRRLTDGIHDEKPDATVAINHYHRQTTPWQTGIPLNPFDVDIVTASESSTNTHRSAYITRLSRAYDRDDVEVWTPIARRSRGRTPTLESFPLVQHALACVTAGGMPSYGGGQDFRRWTPVLGAIDRVLEDRAEYVGLPSAAPAAVHVSEQTETFFFGRTPGGSGRGARTGEAEDWYWDSVMGWHELLTETNVPLDFVFDDHLTEERLSRYGLLVLPLPMALTEEQADAITEFVADGGTLVTGPWPGTLDEWGEHRAESLLSDVVDTTRPPMADEIDEAGTRTYWEPTSDHAALFPSDSGPITVHALASGVSDVGGETIAVTDDRDPAISHRRHGDGVIVSCHADVGRSYFYEPNPALREWLGNVIDRSFEPSVHVDGPSCVHTGLFRDGDKLLLHLHNFPGSLSRSPESRSLPTETVPVDVEVTVDNGATTVERLVESPNVTELTGDATVIEGIDLHEIVALRP